MNDPIRLHREAMALADRAMIARLQKRESAAVALFRHASEREALAAQCFADAKIEPTRSILYRSAASLSLDCGDHATARQLIESARLGMPPAEVEEELSVLLNMVENVEMSIVMRNQSSVPALQAPPSVVPVSDEESDQDVISRVVGGERDAFAVLIGRYSDSLYRHALGMTGSPDVAEDILQTSFIKAFHHLREVRGRFDAWLFRIVANGCKDWMLNIRRAHLSSDEDDQASVFAASDEGLDRTGLQSDLDSALAQLAPSLREAFVKKHVEGRSYEEMADLLGTTVGVLKMRVQRAREALQALLEEKDASPAGDDTEVVRRAYENDGSS
ncbi:MAG: RNA polymerase sigma factor [Gemmatimonadaceae bacterium]|nr:RNA polymerase sigma factor [Gemmatimonadaceae bacterium]